MCFCISERFNEPYTAKKDIVVYKYLTYNNSSPFYNSNWVPNKIQTVHLVIDTEYLHIDSGLHAYTDSNFLHKNYHGFRGKYRKCKFHKFIIPKGSIYYKNPYRGEVVSESMYWTGKVRKYCLYWKKIA